MNRDAAIYVRQSLDRDGERAAVGRQEAECRALAALKGWSVAKVYSDNDKSATSGHRPAWRDLLSAVRAGQVTAVIAWHTDRLYRRTRDTLELIEAGEEHGLIISTVRAGELDLSTPAGRMIATQLSAVAAYEVQQKGDRQRSANKQRAQHGVVGWTRRPFGYDHDAAGNVVIVETEAQRFREAAEMVLGGATLSAAARELNAQGARTTIVRHGCADPAACADDAGNNLPAGRCPQAQTGGPWGVVGLRRLLLNPRHAGRAVSKGTDYGAGGWEPIFDADTADRLAALLNDPERRTAPPSTNVKYLLSGIVLCGVCGGPLYASPNGARGRRWMVYKCFKSAHLVRRLDLVDQVVDGLVVERMSRPDAAVLLSPTVDVASLQGEADQVRRRRDALAAMLGENLLPEEAVREQARRLRDRLGEIERQLDAASGGSPLLPLVGASDVASVWTDMGLDARRESVRALFLSLTVLPVTRGARFDPSQVAYVWRRLG